MDFSDYLNASAFALVAHRIFKRNNFLRRINAMGEFLEAKRKFALSIIIFGDIQGRVIFAIVSVFDLLTNLSLPLHN